eukprot:TRINITY_DN15336_c0_g1_i1.p1 TRINITY_DN15336_c0_g1~~TRINITY_DN15336_c0_g1_i1.p1  ORF type:complete len:628 (+),score=242.76 TRINITY_DN15336_c0_g1_i1:93-1976(+)
MAQSVRVGCYSAMWGDSTMSATQLLDGGRVQYLVGDYLAEVTMAIMAKAKMASKGKYGYATDFVQVMVENFKAIRSQGVKVLVNAGGVNPVGCKAALEKALEKAYPGEGRKLKIGVVLGDDVSTYPAEVQQGVIPAEHQKTKFASLNAYLGAFPLAAALGQGCDVVITGRVVDSALVLAPLIHEHKWTGGDYDLLSSGTLAGHLVECGAQGTGGLFTDYHDVPNWANVGYPVVDVQANGSFTISKPPGTGGLVTPASVTEQMLYEIGDPGAYLVPDVACDWTQVAMSQLSEDTVLVQHAKGRPPTESYKTIGTYADGTYSMIATLVIEGRDAVGKARRTAEALLERWGVLLEKKKFAPFKETRVELLGHGGTRYPPFLDLPYTNMDFQAPREVVLRMSVRHGNAKALQRIRREVSCAGVSMGAGTIGLIPGLPTPSAVVRCAMFLIPKSACPPPTLLISGAAAPVPCDGLPAAAPAPPAHPPAAGVTRAKAGALGAPVVYPKEVTEEKGRYVLMTLDHLAHGRSGDKGDTANIGIIPRKPRYHAYLLNLLTPEVVKHYFKDLCKGDVVRYELPGTSSMNFLLHNALGGGGTSSLHSDPLAKTYASMLLAMPIYAPAAWRHKGYLAKL